MKSFNHNSPENIARPKPRYVNSVFVVILILTIVAMVMSNGLACLLGGTALLFAGYSLPTLVFVIDEQAQELRDQHKQIMSQHDLISELVTLTSNIPPRGDVTTD